MDTLHGPNTPEPTRSMYPIIFLHKIYKQIFIVRYDKSATINTNHQERKISMKKFFAELLGTFFLVFFGTGAAVLGGGADSILGYGAIGLAFGLAVVASAYSIGAVSGAHLNPAVSIAMFYKKRLSSQDLINYILAQVIGAFLGSLTLMFILGDNASLGQNVVQSGFSLTAGFIAEVILTFTLVLVILTVTSSKYGNPGMAGLIIGLTLLLIHFIGVPVSSMSANPARSLAPAILAGGQAISQLWLFVLAPIVGGMLAAIIHSNLIDQD